MQINCMGNSRAQKYAECATTNISNIYNDKLKNMEKSRFYKCNHV